MRYLSDEHLPEEDPADLQLPVLRGQIADLKRHLHWAGDQFAAETDEHRRTQLRSHIDRKEAELRQLERKLVRGL